MVKTSLVRSGQERANQGKSGQVILELVAVNKGKTKASRTSHYVNRQCVAKDQKIANKATMKHRENGMRPSGNPKDWSMMQSQTRKALHAVLRT